MKALIGATVSAALLMQAAAVKAEEPIEAPGPAGPLRGTLVVAQVPRAPVVLVVPGSGPTDRDGNNALGIKAATYRLLAEGLASAGISSVRIDKRGMFGSAGAVPDPNAVTISDYVTDVAAWSDVIRTKTKSNCIWIAGHSEGGLVALAAAQKIPKICGLLLISTAGRPLADVLREQLKANPANVPFLDQALLTIDRLKSGARVNASELHPALMPLFHPLVQGFWIDAFSYDPAKLAAAYKGPMLILQGTHDLQTSVTDAELLAHANLGAKLALLPQVNHVLKKVDTTDRAINIATYANPNLPLASGVVEAVSEFIKAH